MRRLLAATLILALTAGLPAAAFAQDPSEGETADGAEAPRQPPSDAVVLALDAEPYEARIDELHEVDWYRFTAVEGHDYWILADTGRGGSWMDVDINVALHDATGAEVEVAASSESNDLRWVVLEDARAATYYVRIYVAESSIDAIGNYGLEVRTIDDDHGNTAAEGTLVHPGSAVSTEHTGRSDHEDDRDWLLFDARAGDIYRITARGAVSLGVYAFDPVTGAVGDRLSGWHIEQSGRYAVSISESVNDDEYPSQYTVMFEKLTDDRPNVPDDPAPLRLGRQTGFTLDYGGDVDWFAIDLVEGEQYLVTVAAAEPTFLTDDRLDLVAMQYLVTVAAAEPTPPAAAQIILHDLGSDPQDPYDERRHTLSFPTSSRRAWRATGSGRHLVEVRTGESRRGGGYPAEFSITVGLRPADDHADDPEGATTIRPGTWVEAALGVSGDEDWYRFAGRAGVVYSAEVEVRGEGADVYVPSSSSTAGFGTLAYLIDDDWGFDAEAGYAFAVDGTQYLIITARWSGESEKIDYRFRLVEHESVDYGDDRSAARVVRLGETVIGSATDQDADWFAFDAVAGGIYTVSSGSAAVGVTVFDDAEEVPPADAEMRAGGEQRSGRSRVHWTAPSPGRYWIRLSGKWAQPHVYRLGLSYTPATADDHGDTAEEATNVLLAPGSGASPGTSGGSTDLDERIGERRAFVEGRLQNFLDEDWFALRLERGVKYRIIPHAPDSGYYRAEEEFNEDAGFSLWSGEILLDWWTSWNPTFGIVPTETGTYHLAVGRGSGRPFLEPLEYNFAVEVLHPDDVPDLREGGLLVEAGAVLEGTLDTTGDLDWFRLAARRGQTWILQSATSSLACAQVYGPGALEPLAEECREERLVWVVPATGEYGLRLSSKVDINWVHRTPFDYRLTLSVPDPDDHGNSAWDTSPLVGGAEQSGTMDYVGDRDVFRLAVAEGEVWELDVSLSGYGTEYSTRFVSGSGGVDPSGVPSRDAQGGFLGAPTDGAWLITVTGDRGQGTYTLVAEKLDVTDDYGNDRDHAHVLAGPATPEPGCGTGPNGDGCSNTTSVEGKLDYRGDSDYFRATLQAGTKYEISVSSESEQVIFTLLADDSCALPGPTDWEKAYDTWVPEATGDHWVRVGFDQWQYTEKEPADYTLEITAHGDEFLTIPERAPRLEPNVVYEVSGDEFAGSDLYRVSVDHSRYVIEVNGEGFGAGGISPGEQFDATWWEDESRFITPLPSNPPPVYFFRVSGPAGEPYTVVVREHVPSDNDLEWKQVHVSPAPPPTYC